VEATGLAVHAWALLPNHLHLLVQTGRRPLAAAMRRLLRETEAARGTGPRAKGRAAFPGLLATVARAFSVTEAEPVGGGRRAAVAQAREAVSALAAGHLGLSRTDVARALDVAPATVRRGVSVGAALSAARRLDPARVLAGLK
jgi:hypothetical protein